MAKEKTATLTNRPKKPKLLETVNIPSNPRRSLCQMVHRFEFSNTANNLIEVEEIRNPSKINKHDLAIEEETSIEEDSRITKDFKDSRDIS